MAHTKKCGRLNEHESHEWNEEVAIPNFVRSPYGPDTGTHYVNQVNWCEGIPAKQSEEGKLQKLRQVEYRGLKRVRFEFENREGIETEVAFEDILPTDGVARITVVNNPEGIADGWATVEIRILARKPFIAREVETDGR